MDLRLATLADAEAIRAIYNVEVLESTSYLDELGRVIERASGMPYPNLSCQTGIC